MNSISEAIAVAVGLMALLLAAQLVGRAIGRRQVAAQGAEALAVGRAAEATVAALLGLLIAFTFSGASSRYEARRALVVDQVTALGTAWSRLDLLAAEDQEPARALFRLYVEGLLEASEKSADDEVLVGIVARLRAIEQDLWRLSVDSVARSDKAFAPTLVLPALNQATDLTESRFLFTRIHLQTEVILFLIFLAVTSALIVGHSNAVAKRAGLMHMLIYASLVSLAIYLILDFEYPRIGLITLDAGRDFMADFRSRLN